jgi:teichuronic acid biosynthesis glycosyltransferase TuaG
MTKEVVVSIIMPTYNAGHYLDQAVESVLKQTFSNWQLIIVDDASIDGSTQSIENKYTNDNRIHILRMRRNHGAAFCRNKALLHSTGRYIAFLDSDDIWYPNKLKTQLEFISSNKADMVFSSYDVMTDNKTFVRKVNSPPKVTYKDIISKNPIGCLTVLYDSHTIGKIPMPNIKMRNDWGLWIRIIRLSGHAVSTSQSLAALRKHKDSLTSNKFIAIYYSYILLRKVNNLSFFESVTGVVSQLLYSIFNATIKK